MSKIRIVNWLLTRRCNLRCDYCAIVKNYVGKPDEYPDMNYYIKNEMSLDTIKKYILILKRHNPDMFHIWYGGEPLLRKDLADIINFCNDENIHYTIISNNTEEIQPLIKKLCKDVKGKIKGFTASIDPVFYDTENLKEDRVIKSIAGLHNLLKMKEYVEDVVAEITVMKHNQQYLYKLITLLTNHGINSDVTFIDISKSPYYDFSNIYDENLLVGHSYELSRQFDMIRNTVVDVHMKEKLIPAIWDILPSNMDCQIQKNLHNISIDADGSIRLCLRIRGVTVPNIINMNNLFNSNMEVDPTARAALMVDKMKYCKLCNHTCHLMSKIIDDNDLGPDELVHLDRR